MAKIHPSAIVDSKAELAADVEVGPFAIIESGVCVGARSRIGPRAHVCSGTVIGADCEVHIGAVLGHAPQDFSYKNEPTVLDVGDGTVVREYATLHRATGEGRKTEIGKKCYLMGGAHVAHNCKLGRGVILANNVLLAGHVEIGDDAILSGGVVVHQFVRIGALAILSGGSRFGMDVPPYVIGDETNAVTGLNSVGLRRNAFLTDDDRREIRKAFKIFFRSGLDLAEALRVLRVECTGAAVRGFVEFFETASRRGYCRYRPGSRYGGRRAKTAREETDVGGEE